MSKRIGRVLVGVLTLATMGVAGSGCRQDLEREPEPSRIGIQEEHEQRKAGLLLQFSDDFSKEYGPPDYFDMTRWTRTRIGAGLATTERSFNPGLAGTNGVEITRQPPAEGWCLTIGSWQGLVGGQTDAQKDRGVQLHFDLMRPDGLFVYLVRGLVPEDFEKYPIDGFRPADSPGGRNQGLSARQQRELHEKEISHGGVFISVPCLSLAARVYRTEQEIQDMLGRSRRWGLYLTDDANTVYWTLDDRVMDSIDISGYFSSSPESVEDGAFLSVSGLGLFERNTWKMDDLEMYVSP